MITNSKAVLVLAAMSFHSVALLHDPSRKGAHHINIAEEPFLGLEPNETPALNDSSA